MKLKKVGELTALSLIVIFWSLILGSKLNIFFLAGGFSLEPWHRRHNSRGKGWSLEKHLLLCQIQNDLVYLLTWNVFFFLDESIKICLQALSRFIFRFHSLEKKNAFAKIDPILRYVVL